MPAVAILYSASYEKNLSTSLGTCKISFLNLDYIEKIKKTQSAGVGGVTVSMVAFQAADPGSTPGRRMNSFSLDDLFLF